MGVSSIFEPALASAVAYPDEALRQLDQLDYEEDLAAFLMGGWRYIDPAEFKSNWHLDAIAEHLQAVTYGHIRRLIINVPPRTSKSSMVSVAWPAWTWAQSRRSSLSGPGAQFLFASYAHKLALRDSVKTRRLIASPWYQALWRDRFVMTGDQNTKERFDNDRGGYRLATSVDGMLTGEGGNIIVVDDPHNTREIESETVVASTLTWWDESMSTRLNDPKTGAYCIIMQRQAENDLTGHVLAKEHQDWEHLMLPMEYEPQRAQTTWLAPSVPWRDPRTEDGELLWPERFGPREVQTLKSDLGTFASAGQLQQRPTARGGGIIKTDSWQLWPPSGEKTDEAGKPLAKLSYPAVRYIVGSVDTAMTEDTENDYSAMTVWGIWLDSKARPKAILMDAWELRLEFHPLIEKIIETGRKWRLHRLLIEAKANGLSVAQEIRRMVQAEEWGTTAQPLPARQDKVSRAYSVQHLFENGLIYSPNRKWAQKVIDECGTFPKGKHDDLVDSVIQAVKHLRDTSQLQMALESDEALRKRLAPHGVETLPYDV